ncbi:MAG: glycosyltransferase family 2 protein [Desulfovibrionaceae bacterium]
MQTKISSPSIQSTNHTTDERALVSITIPTYNRVDLLKLCLESAVSQTYGNLEIIVADNHSTDGTEELCMEYKKHDSRIRYYRHEKNFGGQYNINFLCKKATGNYFYSLNDDDFICNNTIMRSVSVLEKDPQCSVVYGATKLYNIDGTLKYFEKHNDIVGNTFGERVRSFCKRGHALPVTTGLMRKENIDAVGGQGSSFCEDQLYIVKMFYFGTMLFLDDIFFHKTTKCSTTVTLDAMKEEYILPSDMHSGNYMHKLTLEYMHSILYDPFYELRLQNDEKMELIYSIVLAFNDINQSSTKKSSTKKRSKLAKIMRIIKGKEI